MELEAEKIKHNEITTISIRFLLRNDDELEAMYDHAPIQEFWFPLSEKAVWASRAMDVWRDLSPFDASRGETGTILPKFQSIQKRHSSKEWVLTDTHNGWEGTTQDFLMCKKGHALTVHAVGSVIELVGQNEAPFPTKQHKAKFIRDLLRIHVLRGEKAELYGVITDKCRVDVVRLSGPATAPTIVRTSTADRASEYIGQLLKCTAEQLGNACSVFICGQSHLFNDQSTYLGVERAGDIEMENEDDGKFIVVASGRLLGIGVQSIVFVCADRTANFIKTFHWRASFEVELKALRTLKGVAGVPDLIAVSDECLALLAAPIGTPLRHYLDKSVCLIKVACGLVYTLRNTHGLHIVHRDISPNNIIVGEGWQGLLIDWATSSSTTAVETEYQGSTLFASNAVLKVCSSVPAESPISLMYEKYMDLESLVKTMFYSMYSDYIAPVFKLKGNYAATLEFWQRCEQKHPRLSALLVAARNCDYEKLHDLFII